MGDLKPLLGEVAGGTRDWGLEICVFLAGPLSSFFLFFQLFCGVVNRG